MHVPTGIAQATVEGFALDYVDPSRVTMGSFGHSYCRESKALHDDLYMLLEHQLSARSCTLTHVGADPLTRHYKLR
jgi:hypothetical protein